MLYNFFLSFLQRKKIASPIKFLQKANEVSSYRMCGNHPILPILLPLTRPAPRAVLYKTKWKINWFSFNLLQPKRTNTQQKKNLIDYEAITKIITNSRLKMCVSLSRAARRVAPNSFGIFADAHRVVFSKSLLKQKKKLSFSCFFSNCALSVRIFWYTREKHMHNLHAHTHITPYTHTDTHKS